MKTILLALLLAVPTTLAWHDPECAPEAAPNTHEVAGLHLWVQPSTDVQHTSWGVWEESNDIAGLQRYDAVADETCHGAVEPDTEIIVFYAV